MDIYDIENAETAEALYLFCSIPEVFEDLCKHSQYEDLSLAEYVYKYNLSAFSQWLEDYKRGNL